MIVGGICCGMIADKWHCHRTVVTLVCLGSLVAITTQPVVSVYYGNPDKNRCPAPIIKDIQTADMNMNMTSEGIECSNSSKMLTTQFNCSLTHSSIIKLKNYSAQKIYVLMFSVNFFISFCEGSSLAFIDSGTLRRSQLATKSRPIHYGHQRMFSTFGAIIGILFSNLTVDFFPHNEKITCYAGIFLAYGMYTVLYGVFTIISYRGLSFREENRKGDPEAGNTSSKDVDLFMMKEKNEGRDKGEETNETKKDRTNFRRLFINTVFQFDILFFYSTTLISGIELSQYISFLFVYLKEMNAPSSLLTLSIVITALTAMAFFAYSHAVVRLIGGKWRAILFSLIVYFVRYLGVSFIQNPWLVLLLQPLHALSTDLFVTTGLLYLKETSPLPVFTSMVSIFNTIHYGLGTFVGSSISGVIFQRYGGRALFQITALLSLGWFCLALVYVLFKEKRRLKNAKKSTEDVDGISLTEPPSEDDKSVI